MVKISDDKWDTYDENDFGFKPYYFGGIQCDSKNSLWVSIDYSLSSTWISPSPHFFIFDGKNTTLDNMYIGPPITIDHNGYVWFPFGVWNGKKFTQFDSSKFGGSGVWVVKESPDYRMWFVTENGIYIR